MGVSQNPSKQEILIFRTKNLSTCLPDHRNYEDIFLDLVLVEPSSCPPILEFSIFVTPPRHVPKLSNLCILRFWMCFSTSQKSKDFIKIQLGANQYVGYQK